MDLNQTRVFVEVVRAGGFAAAARRLGVPKSTISARVQALEARLGAQLLKRSTRQLSLTSEGSAYFETVACAVDTLVDAEAATTAEQGVLSGRIRFTAPLEFPRDAITAALASFCSAHPKVRFDVLLTNQPLDLVAQNIDLALRGGDPGGAGHIIRKVGEIASGLFASPGYIDRCGRPASLPDLENHDLLLFTSTSQSRVLRAVDPLAGHEPRIVSDNFAFLRRLALAGLGIAALPDAVVANEVAGGRLERLLDGWTSEPSALYLVFPSRRDMTPRVKAFADHLVAALSGRASSI
ncbi:LysR family transcriptional regulator [Sphingomonas xanthus]|uniref:LysR family transcriptional regulator n=1 Tax=Sphingomonas xanthus TaxID=2594473 RepID=A0A516IPM3_9SPHN|nr:LysR family transcriptional regulator [Sphingomonas xanthus]QDP18704.1 LysR family transcriptional regulator [Sphingomonas xanthus]